MAVKIDFAVKEIIENNPVVLATSDRFNRPNVIPVAYVKVIGENKLLITDNFMRKTKENLKKNNNVCLAVWDKNWQGYKLIGKAKYFSSGKWKKVVAEMKENKGLSAKGAILVSISKLIKLK